MYILILFGNFCVLDILASLAQLPSHTTALSVTGSYFQPAKLRLYKAVLFLSADPSQHEDHHHAVGCTCGIFKILNK